MATPNATTEAARPAIQSSRIRELLRLVDQPGILSMAGGLPAPESLDVERVREAAGAALDVTGPLGPVALQYGPTEGADVLRALLAARHGVDLDSVLVTTGSQQAIDLVARALCSWDDVVVMEAPSYLGAVQSFAGAGARIVAIDGDRGGLDVERLESEIAAGLRPRVVYVVPNFHNPTGSVLTSERRARLAALARTHGFVIVEDDPYGELRFEHEALPPIASWGPGVVQIGSVSKILGPGLRIGWMVGPRGVLDAVSLLKQAADLHTSSFTQLVVASLLADHDRQDAHLRSIRALYRERSTVLDRALRERLGGRIELQRPIGGMFAWVRATDGTDTDELLDRALAQGVAFVPGSAFTTDPARFRDCFRLSFATLGPDELSTAVDRLAAAWRPGPAPSGATPGRERDR